MDPAYEANQQHVPVAGNGSSDHGLLSLAAFSCSRLLHQTSVDQLSQSMHAHEQRGSSPPVHLDWRLTQPDAWQIPESSLYRDDWTLGKFEKDDVAA
jgi:hypothetical protein